MAIGDKAKGRGARKNEAAPDKDPDKDGAKVESTDQTRTKVRTQIDLILDGPGAERGGGTGLPGAAVHPSRDEPAYLFRDNHILFRDSDLARVREVVEGTVVVGRVDPRNGRSLNVDGLTVYQLAGGRSTVEVLDQLDRELGTGIATPDHVLYLCASGNRCPATEPEEVPAGIGPDPGVGAGAHGGWNHCDGAGTLVSIVDNGLTAGVTQPWMAGVTGDPEFATTAANGILASYAGHGTFSAGVVRTMAPRAEVYIEDAFPVVGAAYESDVVAQIGQALDRGPDVIAMAFGCTTREDRPLLSFELIRRRLAEHKGVALVVAAGNDDTRVPFWPAASPWTVSVGALTRDGRARASFSNYGGWVDVFAPGEQLVNAFCTGDYVCTEPPNVGEVRRFDGMARWSGTSFSAPLVAGLIAARISATGENGRQAAAALLARGRKHAIPGLGAALLPGQACDPDPQCGCAPRSGHGCC